MNRLRTAAAMLCSVVVLLGLEFVAGHGPYASVWVDILTVISGSGIYFAWAGDFKTPHKAKTLSNIFPWFCFAFGIVSIRLLLLAFGIGAGQVGGLETLTVSTVIAYAALVAVIEGDISKRLPRRFWVLLDFGILAFFSYLSVAAAFSPSGLVYFIDTGSFVYDEISITGAVFLLTAFVILLIRKGPELAPVYLITGMVLFDVASCVTNIGVLSWVTPYMNIQTVLWESLLIGPALFCGITYRFDWKALLLVQGFFFACFEWVLPFFVSVSRLPLLPVYIAAEPLLMLACFMAVLRIVVVRK